MNKLLIIGLVLSLLLVGIALAEDRTGVFPIDGASCTTEEITPKTTTLGGNDEPLGPTGGNSNGWCAPKWTCGEWSECRPDGLQIRSCIDKWECGTINDLPPLFQKCSYQGPVDLFNAPGEFVDESEIDVDFEEFTFGEEPQNEITGGVVGNNQAPDWLFPIIVILILAGLAVLYLFAIVRKQKDADDSNRLF